MRLINVETEQLEDFSPHQKPKYAVLSHRWTKKEVTFAEICGPNFRSTSSPTKFRGTLQQAANDGLKYVWIDTCCIDKTSSTELSEAVNSMYRWYQGAESCYVYLHDVKIIKWQESFPISKWFKRGWTLQELLAPRTVIFYDQSWQKLGDRRSLVDEISRVTGITINVLQTGDLKPCSVAQKMAWASRRVTTRPEDRAYCLMGLFGVNMPLLYGEGEKAFLRFQEEIIKHNDDRSIFAWRMGKMKFSGLLAPSPDRFARSREMVNNAPLQGREPFSMTNRGLSIKFKITPWLADTYLAKLDCSKMTESGKERVGVGIFLRRLREDDQYVRVNHTSQGLWFGPDWKIFDTDQIQFWPNRPVRYKQLFVRQLLDFQSEAGCLKPRVYGFKFSNNLLQHHVSAFHNLFDRCVATLRPGGWGCIVVIDVSAQYEGLRKIALGFDFDFNPVCILEDSFLDSQYSDTNSEHLYDWSGILADDMEWDEIAEGSWVDRKEAHDGRWALKGHRLWGLDVLLRESSTDKGSLVTLKRDERQPRLIWELDIDSLVGPSRNHHHKALRSAFRDRRNFQASYGLGMTNQGLQEGDDVLKAIFPSY